MPKPSNGVADLAAIIPQIARRYDDAVTLERLKPHPKNPNEGDVGLVIESIETNGFAVPIIAQESSGLIIDGEHRWHAARHEGMASVPVLFYDCDDETALRLLLAINETTRKGTNGLTELTALLAELAPTSLGLAGTGFDTDDFDRLISDLAGMPAPGDGGDEFDATPEDGPTRCQPGDLWRIGDHRLLCGDSTNAEDVARLMGGERASIVWSDPPYGYSYQSNMRVRSEKFDVLTNDDRILCDFVPVAASHSDGWFLVCTSWKVFAEWIHATRPLGELQNVIVWDKGGGGMGDLTHSLLTDYELILAYNRGEEIKGKRLGSVWSIGKDRPGEYLHATQKPVELVTQALDTFAPTLGVVYDPFGGSGTTLVAAHRTGRTAYCMEIDPRYCDVILKRAEAEGIGPIELIETHGDGRTQGDG